MYNLAKIRLHKDAASNIPATGQRRDMLLKALRKIQISPEQGGDFQWQEPRSEQATEVTVTVGYAISWISQDGLVSVLDIRGQ